MGQFKQTLFLGGSSSKKYGISGGGDGDKDACGRGGSLCNGSTGNIGEGTCGRSSGKGNCGGSGREGIPMVPGIRGGDGSLRVVCKHR